MKPEIRKGVLKSLGYYIIATVTTWLAYIVFGWEYKHGPALFHFVGFFFLVGGTCYLVYNLFLLLTSRRSEINYGALIVHFTILTSVILFVIVGIANDKSPETKLDPKDILTIHIDSITNKASVTNGNGDTLLMKKGDSIIKINPKEKE